MCYSSKVSKTLSTFRKPCSGYKMKEMTGSGIFHGESDEVESEIANLTPANKTGIRMYQVSVHFLLINIL